MSNLMLKTLTGSRAYGLETEDSDWDFHAVFVTPTSELLSLGQKPAESVWREGGEDGWDFQSWELGRFLHLAVKCNPTVLETFVAPPYFATLDGWALRALFPRVLSRKRVFDAYRGYAHNQRAKLFNKPDDPTAAQPGERAWKFAAQYLRILMQGERLLQTGELVLDMFKYGVFGSAKSLLLRVKNGRLSMGYVIDSAVELEKRLEDAYDNSEIQEEADLGAVNEFLLRIRKGAW